jgi:hypothetical protein
LMRCSQKESPMSKTKTQAELRSVPLKKLILWYSNGNWVLQQTLIAIGITLAGTAVTEGFQSKIAVYSVLLQQ